MNSKQTRVLTTILLWGMVLGMIVYMVLMGSGVKKPVELTLKDFLTLVEEDKVAAVKEELGSGLFYGLRQYLSAEGSARQGRLLLLRFRRGF